MTATDPAVPHRRHRLGTAPEAASADSTGRASSTPRSRGAGSWAC